METHNRGINTAHSNAGNNKKKTQIERRKMWLNIRFHFQKRYSWGANIYGKQKIEGDQNKISHTKMNKIMMNKLRIFSILFQTYQKDKSKIEKSERHCSQTCTDLMNTGRTIFILRTSFRRPSVCVCVCWGDANRHHRIYAFRIMFVCSAYPSVFECSSVRRHLRCIANRSNTTTNHWIAGHNT